MTSPAQGHVAGIIATATGLGTAALIYRHPEHLLVPGWVAYSACAAFVLAGLAILAQAHVGQRYYRWLVVALLGAMLVPPLWAAFGSSAQSCSAAILGLSFVPTDVVCRGVWAVSAMFLFVMLLAAARWALARPNAVEPP